MRYEKSLKELIGDEAEGYTRLALSQVLKSATTSVDDLIRIGVLGVRDLSPQEISRLREEIARMPFNTGTVKVQPKFVGRSFLGKTFGKYERSDLMHLFKRIEERQWQDGTTFDE